MTPSRAPSLSSLDQILAAMAIAGRGGRKVASVSFEDIAVSFATARFAILQLRWRRAAGGGVLERRLGILTLFHFL